MRADLRAPPGHLDRIDGWLADGTIGGERVNSPPTCRSPQPRADAIGDVRQFFAGRPAEAHATGPLPTVGRGPPLPGVFPAEWLSGA